MKNAFILFFFFATFFNAYAQGPKEKELIVSAAMSLKDVMSKIGEGFEKKYPDYKVSFNFGGSGQLRAQIESGAPVDVFASASQADIDELEKKNLLEKKTRVDFAKNILVLAQSIHSKFMMKNINDLSKDQIKKIAIGNPETVPAGRYAKESLSFYKIFDQLKEKLVFGENVRQVLDYISKNEVDAGFVFLTDVLTDKNVQKILEVPSEAHKPIIYPAAVIASSKQINTAKEFIKFMTDKESKEIFKKYGFN